MAPESKIEWQEWGKESFERAKKEDKPVLLDLTAVWCHWCHVMDATSYSDEEAIRVIKQDFIPIKVDIDKRPDIRERYNMGGFPSTVFLNHDGYRIAGDTYIPPQRFRLVLKTIAQEYKKRKKDWQHRIDEIRKAKQIEMGKLEPEIVKQVLLSVEDNFDRFYGGFGLQPKFPAPEVLDLLFGYYTKTKNKKYLDMALKTLDGMHEGIYDKIGFGFFRYSVTQDWKTPHYEKMLDTNAGLLRNYADAYEATKNEKYKKIAIETIEYVGKTLSGQAGFYGSQDADEEFYLADEDERMERKQPYVDKTIYVDWNSMMISSYIKAGLILGDKNAVDFAAKTADFILEKCYEKENGLFHFFDGKPNLNGLLGDNIHFLNCLIDAYSATKNEKYLEKAKEIAGFILKSFYDASAAGFFDRIAKDDDLGALKEREKNFPENSLCAIVFLRLCSLMENPKYKEIAEKTLLLFSDVCLNYGYFSSTYAIAAGMFLDTYSQT